MAYGNKFRDRQLLGRIDHSFSNSDQLSIRNLYDSNTNPTGGNSVAFSGYFTSQQNEVNSGLLNETHTFSPLEFRGESYNVFNHRQYGFLSASAFDANANLSIGANVTNTAVGHFLVPGFADGGARVLKFQVKVVF